MTQREVTTDAFQKQDVPNFRTLTFKDEGLRACPYISPYQTARVRYSGSMVNQSQKNVAEKVTGEARIVVSISSAGSCIVEGKSAMIKRDIKS